MRVVLLAADDFVVPPPEGDAEILARLGVTSPFVLAVGAADRRKNLALLDRAMPRVIEHVPTAQLVLAGPRRRSSRHQESWRKTLGFVSDRELAARSEEHTSELQSHSDLVCRLLLETKNKNVC